MSMTATDRKPFNPRRRLTADERRRLEQTMRLQSREDILDRLAQDRAYHDAYEAGIVTARPLSSDSEPEPPRGVSSWLFALAAVSVLGVLAMVYFAFVVPR